MLVGDVWIGSGQSNMAGSAGGYAKRDSVLADMVKAAPYPQLRLYRGGWKEATESNIKGFSALLFSFGQPLQKELGVPVGLIVGAVGGLGGRERILAAMRAMETANQELQADRTQLRKELGARERAFVQLQRVLGAVCQDGAEKGFRGGW